MPTKSSSVIVPVVRKSVVCTYTPAGGLSYLTQTPMPEGGASTLESLSKTWVRTANFTNLKRTHTRLPDNAFSYDLVKAPETRGHLLAPQYKGAVAGSWTQREYWWSGPFLMVIPSAPVLSNMNWNALNAQLIQKAKGNQWNVPIFLAEGRKTIEMVAQSATRLALCARALRRGRFDDFVRLAHPSAAKKLHQAVKSGNLTRKFGKSFAADPVKTFSQYWLEHTYGWVPFMSDIRSAVNTLLDVRDHPDSLDGTVRAKYSSGPITTSSRNVLLYTYSAESLSIYGNTSTLSKQTLKGTWRYSLKPEDIPGRFGLLNPLEVAWELVPFSFVADWFAPIGDYFAALDAPKRFNHLGGTYGVRVLQQYYVEPTRALPTGSVFTGGKGLAERITVQRVLMTGIPSVSLSAIRMDPNLGIKRLTSAFALVNTVFRKR